MTRTRPVALVTGGTRGVGLGIAGALAGAGCDLVINGRRPAEEVAVAVHQLEQAGARVHYLQADVARRADHEALIEAIDHLFGRLDVLVNNAGVAPAVRTDILEATEESFDRLMAINLKGPYFLTQRVARYMIEHREDRLEGWRGRIVNISSISATMASVQRGDYCITKAGIAMATQLWAVRLAEFGIDVYEVRPGIIATDMTATVKEKYDRLLEDGLALERRWGRPEDVGRAVAALVRGEIPYATGLVLTLDGGVTVPRL